MSLVFWNSPRKQRLRFDILITNDNDIYTKFMVLPVN